MKRIIIGVTMALASSLCFAQQAPTSPNGAAPEAPTTNGAGTSETPATNGGASEGAGRAAGGIPYKQGVLIGTIAIIAVGAAAALSGSNGTTSH
jgi:hypothetical protein